MNFNKLSIILSTIGLLLASQSFAAEESAKVSTWKHQSELGVIVTGGNNKSDTENLKHTSKKEWGKNILKASGQFIHGATEGAAETRIWSAELRYDRLLDDKFSLFIGNLWEGDQASGYDYRSSIDLGGKYIYFKEEDEHLSSELGYRFTYQQNLENSSPSLTRSHFVRVYNEWYKSWTEGVSTKFWVEVLPDLSNSENIQVNSEISLSTVLSSVFSLKLAYLYKYDNVPAVAGLKRVDFIYTTTLVANF